MYEITFCISINLMNLMMSKYHKLIIYSDKFIYLDILIMLCFYLNQFAKTNKLEDFHPQFSLLSISITLLYCNMVMLVNKKYSNL